MLKYLSFLLISLVFMQELFGSCGDDRTLKTKIQHLKMEVVCASADSLHLCQKLLNEFHPIVDKDMPTEPAEITAGSCGISTATLLPASVAARSLAREMNKVVSFRPKLVNSVEEFYEHTRLHRERVKALGLELFKTHPELFEGLTPAKVAAILESHDLAKVTASSVGPDGRPFYRTLYENGYGKQLDRTTVDALNSRDKVFMEQAIAKHGLKDSPELIAQMQRIEKIADFVDRGMSPVSAEEFGRPMDKASIFLKNEDDKKLALELEKKYSKVTKKLSYHGLSFIQQKGMANHLLIEERFAASKSATDSAKLSARAMAHTLMSRGNKILSSVLGFLANKGTTKALAFLEYPMLFFADMDQLGCDGLGYHDWVKNPNCQPAIGLTPKIVKFLGEDWETQQKILNDTSATCRVIQETYGKSITAPKIKSCAANDIEMELSGGDRFKVKLDNENRMREIELQDLSSYAEMTLNGKAKRVLVGANGQVEKVCYETNVRGTKAKKCQDSQSPAITKTKELLKSINYQIQKGIACCRSTNPDLARICPH